MNVLAIKCMQIHVHSIMPARHHGFATTGCLCTRAGKMPPFNAMHSCLLKEQVHLYTAAATSNFCCPDALSSSDTSFSRISSLADLSSGHIRIAANVADCKSRALVACFVAVELKLLFGLRWVS